MLEINAIFEHGLFVQEVSDETGVDVGLVEEFLPFPEGSEVVSLSQMDEEFQESEDGGDSNDYSIVTEWVKEYIVEHELAGIYLTQDVDELTNL